MPFALVQATLRVQQVAIIQDRTGVNREIIGD